MPGLLVRTANPRPAWLPHSELCVMIHCLFLLTDPVVSAVFPNAWSSVKACSRTEMGQTSLIHSQKNERKNVHYYTQTGQPDV